jgi:prepilin-type N-terminal cleavage/methylation domain-containing protein
MFRSNLQNHGRGFSLIEVIVGSAIFLVVAIAGYGAFTSLFQLANGNQERVIAVELANEQFEIIRNMPFSNIGIVSGIPNGTIVDNQSIVRGGVTFNIDYTIRDVDLPFDGQVGSTTNNDLSPADAKFVQINVTCASCQDFQPVTISGQIAPKNLENTTSNGALFVSAIDANGNPVQGASVHVAYTATSSPIIIDDTTNNAGILQIVDVPPAVKAYGITVTKNGYSTDKTYAVSATNTTPVKEPATVAAQTLTQANFSIDKVSAMTVRSVTPMCAPVPNFDFKLTGAKTIGIYSGANIPKYKKDLSTGGSGSLSLNNMEWDSYSINPADDTYDLAGINPLNPIALSPNSTQDIQLVVVPHTGNSLLVTVKDSVTGLPVSNATVHLTGPGAYNKTLITGQGYLSQTDWTGGATQSGLFVSQNSYSSDNGNVDTATSSGNIVIKQLSGYYATNATGTLDSSIFDTGTSSNFFTLSWNPGSQSPLTGAQSVKMQFATDASSTPNTWDFLGPDGTTGSYFTTPNATISTVNNGKEFARYRVYLTTQTATATPIVSDMFFTYTSGCIPPGQVIFQSLQSGNYSLTVSKTGYETETLTVTVTGGWKEQQVIMAP